MTKNTLFIFSNEYPFGTGEPYLDAELKVLSDKFDRIVLFPLHTKGNSRTLPNQRIELVNLFDKDMTISFRLVMKNLFLILSILIGEFLHTAEKRKFLKRLREFRSRLSQNLFRAQLVENYLHGKDMKEVCYYSFWTDDWATVLSLLKKKGVIDRFVSRVHGYDLYKERWPDHIIPFRNFQLKQVDKIVAVSKDGLRYLTEQFPGYQHKFSLSHLSIFDHGEGVFSDSGVFTIVSCSNLIPLKRVHLLAEAILGMDTEAKWVHFGDGPERENIERIIKKIPVSIQVELKGNVANEEIISYYQQHSVNLFVQLSETEGGVPLALQEAASFGIPLLGTDAGGIPEIVNEETGLLVHKDIRAEQLTALLKKIKNSNYNTIVFRKGVRTFWLRFFDAYSNYSEFAERILKNMKT